MEKNLVSVAREVEKLRAEQLNAERRARGLGKTSIFSFVLHMKFKYERMGTEILAVYTTSIKQVCFKLPNLSYRWRSLWNVEQ